ncbi:MAG: hypothetical protein IK075_09455 [Prevotella sp.]|nr:hypothetical protein [Prevotella sp.]
MRRERHTDERMLTGLMRLVGSLMLLAVTALIVVSCGGSGDEPGGEPTPQPQPKNDIPIAFSGNLSEGESESHARTRTALSGTHTTFHVWAYKNPASGPTETVMKNYTVNYVTGTAGTTISNSSGWEYVNLQDAEGVVQGIKYWDFTASDYRFFGYAGTGVTMNYTPSETAPTSVSLSFDASVASNPQQDPVTLPLTASTPLYSKLWYKVNAGLPAQKNQPVTLQFLQPYVKVRFLFRQSESAETVFALTDMSFKPTNGTYIYIKGTFQVYYPLTGGISETWSVTHASPDIEGTDYLTAFTQNYYEAAAGETIPAIIAGEKMWYVVLPAVDQGTYTLSVKVNNEPRNVVVPAQYMNWQPGYEYTYIFKVTDAGGVEIDAVQSAFAPWSYHEKDYPVYNW